MLARNILCAYWCIERVTRERRAHNLLSLLWNYWRRADLRRRQQRAFNEAPLILIQLTEFHLTNGNKNSTCSGLTPSTRSLAIKTPPLSLISYPGFFSFRIQSRIHQMSYN